MIKCEVCGKEMVNHVISVSKKSGVNDIVAILGHESDVVKEKLPMTFALACGKSEFEKVYNEFMGEDQ